MQIEQQRKQLEQAVGLALDIAGRDSDGAEISVTKSTGISVNSRFKQVENIEFNSDGALGITVYKGQCRGSASSTDLNPAAIKLAVEAALDMAKYTSPDPCSGLGDFELMEFNPPDLDLYHPTPLDVDYAIEQAIIAETAAVENDLRIKNSEGGAYSSHYGLRVYGNSHGMLKSYCSSRHSISCAVIAEHDGQMERDYAYTVARDINDLKSAEWVGKACAERTISRLGARKLSTMEVPVIFDAEVATGLFGHLVYAISGGNLYRKTSFLLDHLGQQILPDWLTISERPHLLKGLASSPFDNEGLRTIERDIIKQGILETYLLSSYSARKLGMQSTGHAGGIHNWFVTGRLDTIDQLVNRIDKGLLVTELMGQGVNMITGDYSRGAAGFWVENGEIQYPVSEITIAGNLKQMFSDIVAVADDIEKRGNIQTGSVLIEKMKIAGH